MMRRPFLSPRRPFAPTASFAIAVGATALFFVIGCGKPAESPTDKAASSQAASAQSTAGKETKSKESEPKTPSAQQSTVEELKPQAAQAKQSNPPAKAEEVPASEAAAASENTNPIKILEQMAAAYRDASSYADQGTVRLQVDAGEQKIDETVDFSVTLVRPNKIRVQAYLGKLVCDGKEIRGSIDDLPDQVLVKPAPEKIALRTVYGEPMLANALSRGVAGALPQLMLLLGKTPVKALLADADPPQLLEPGQIEGRDCYRIQIPRIDGAAVLWIDKQNLLLRRVVLPTDELRAAMQDRTAKTLSLVSDFTGARFNSQVDPKAFEFEIPKDAKVVKFFLPPRPAELLGKKSPAFQFTDLDGKPVALDTMAPKIVVLTFWASWCDACKMLLPNLDKVREQFQGNDKVAFCGISIDQSNVDNQKLKDTFESLKVSIPIGRDAEQASARMFRYSGRIPATFIIGADGVVQDYQSGANPNIVAELTQKIEKLLAGENIFEAPIQAYQQEMKQYASRLEKESAASDEEFEREEPKMEEQRLPEIAPAERSAPASFKLAPLWKCEELKSPGNVYVLAGKDETPRLLVVEGSLSVAEVGLDGKLIANHELQLNAEQGEAISNLRIFTTADGKHLVVAFAGAQQRLHLFDENWKHTLSYPEDALKRPHSGIADVELADLQGSGSPQICVGYWGIVGVQAVSPNGERLWSNRSLANVIRMAVGDPDEKGRRNLFCTNNGNNAGAIVALDAAGERRGEIAIPNRPLHTLVAADLAGNGHSSWCGLSATKLGEDVAVGFSLEGEELWNYALPQGPHPRPIELILSGKLLPNGPGQWILPGADGSIHVLSPEGKLLERFNYGETLQGLTVVEIGGKPALIVATAKGLEALSVE